MLRWSSIRPWLAFGAAVAAVTAGVIVTAPPRAARTPSPPGAHAPRPRTAPAPAAPPGPAASPGPAAPPAPTASGARRPTVDAAALHGLGKLAFVSQGTLYVLDGATGALTRITRRGKASYPAWSHDGRWLAYLLQTGGSNPSDQLRLVRADGGDAHVAGTGPVSDGSQYAWSPTADVLAVAPEPQPPRQTNGLWLVPASGPARLLAFGKAAVYSFLWSPDGTAVTADAFDPAHRTDTLATVPAAGGPTTTRFRAPHATGLILASWSPHGRRIALWQDPQHSASIAADGLHLFTLPLSGGAPQPLTLTLPYRSWLSWSPDGRTLAVVAGRGRQTWYGKGVVLCDPTGRGGCPPALRSPAPGGTGAAAVGTAATVTFDPAWSPDGKTLALVAAASRGRAGGWGGCSPAPCSPARQRASAQRQVAAWVSTRRLWLVGARGAARQLRSAGTGVYDPHWSLNGASLLYIRNRAVWEVPAAGGPARRIAGPVDAPYAPYGYYGHLRWSAGWAWYRQPS